MNKIKIGIDIGGTFTDFFIISNNKEYKNKILTNTVNPYISLIDGLNYIFDNNDINKNNIDLIIHGTTLFTNKLIERKGSTPIFFTTKGFSDVLDMQKEMRYDIYDLHAKEVTHLVPKLLRYEIDERIDGDGKIIKPINIKTLEHQLQILKLNHVLNSNHSVAICLLHSYINPTHENIVKDIIKNHFPTVNISLSHEISPLIREYERMSTTICNSYIQPLANEYINNIENHLKINNYKSPLRLMLSSGGITSTNIAKKYPVRLIESGPAAGTLAAAHLGSKSGFKNLLSFDMGGTTAKMCIIENGKPNLTSNFEVARLERFKKGSGLPINIDTIDLIEIGAGGGSIAHIDELKLLKVGPDSAGANPGPCCYNLGGINPTVTDANLVLGYLDSNNFLDGKMALDKKKAYKSIKILSSKLKLNINQTAYGIFRIVNENMITATRIYISEFGFDPRKLYLFAFGGAGPIHAHAIAKALKMPGFIVPTTAGVASAFGFLAAAPSFEFSKTFISILNTITLKKTKKIFKQLEIENSKKLDDFNIRNKLRATYWLNLRHYGQGHDINIECSLDEKKFNSEVIRQAFYKKYEQIYGYAHKHLEIEITLCKIILKSDQPQNIIKSTNIEYTKSKSSLYKEIYDGVKIQKYKYMHGYNLEIDKKYKGPLIIQESETTCVVPNNSFLIKDTNNNYIIKFT